MNQDPWDDFSPMTGEAYRREPPSFGGGEPPERLAVAVATVLTLIALIIGVALLAGLSV